MRNKLDFFRFHCNKVLPLVYDDALSYYEVVCKLVKKMNEEIERGNELEDSVEEIQQMLQNVVTEDFLNQKLASYVTQEYLGVVLGGYTTDVELAEALNNYEPKVPTSDERGGIKGFEKTLSDNTPVHIDSNGFAWVSVPEIPDVPSVQIYTSSEPIYSENNPPTFVNMGFKPDIVLLQRNSNTDSSVEYNPLDGYNYCYTKTTIVEGDVDTNLLVEFVDNGINFCDGGEVEGEMEWYADWVCGIKFGSGGSPEPTPVELETLTIETRDYSGEYSETYNGTEEVAIRIPYSPIQCKSVEPNAAAGNIVFDFEPDMVIGTLKDDNNIVLWSFHIGQNMVDISEDDQIVLSGDTFSWTFFTRDYSDVKEIRVIAIKA